MGMFTDAPTHREIFKSDQAPDGTKRYGFWAKELDKERKEWFKFTALTFGLITLFIFVFMSIYFGSYYDQIWRTPHLTVELIDLDSLASPQGSVPHPAILGPAMRTAVQQQITNGVFPRLGWQIADSAATQDFRLTSSGQGLDAYDYGYQRVENEDVWAVAIVNANATSGVWDALTSGTQWDPSGAITFIYIDARNFYAAEQYVTRLASQLFTQVAATAGAELATQVLALGNASAVLSAAQPGALIGAFSYNQHTIAPFDMTAGIAATTVGAVYLIIFTFLISQIWNQTGLPIIQEKLSLVSEVLVKVLVPFFAYFWLSLHYSLISLAFLVEFNRKYGKGGFVLYWLLNWITMTALGLVMETMYLVLGPFFPFFLLFWVVWNVSVAFLDLSEMQNFYSYGYAFPIWNQVDGAKSIIFATKNHLAQNFAVNLGWTFIMMIVLSSVVIYQRRKKEASKMKEIWGEMKEKDLDRTVGPAE